MNRFHNYFWIIFSGVNLMFISFEHDINIYIRFITTLCHIFSIISWSIFLERQV